MYKLLLCWRYLRTRYIALVCIISVTLGVATMIVVNSVMAGFTHKMEAEMNAMLGDLVLQVHSMDGAPDATAHMTRIRESLGDQVVGMSPTAAVPAAIYMQVGRTLVTKPVTLVGIDEATYAAVSNLGRYLQHPANRERLSFDLHEQGYDVTDHAAADPKRARPRPELGFAGASYRRAKSSYAQLQQNVLQQPSAGGLPAQSQQFDDPFAAQSSAASAESRRDAGGKQHAGIILALSEVSTQGADGATHLYNRPGDDVRISFPTASLPAKIVSDFCTIVDVYQEPMRIENASLAFVSLKYLQDARNLLEPLTGVGKFTSIQIKLRPGADVTAARERLRSQFDAELYTVATWQDNQAMLLHAIQTETMVLNILLFFIVAVAGFGILAIFYMIVVEKTRDIGILKSLGASGRGVMGIFLAYGLSLGIVGAGAGTLLGATFSEHINEAASLLERMQGAPVFDPSVYFFDKIPTLIDPWTVAWINCGAVGIAVLASILPARRAAKLHPVAALRFE